MRIRTTATLPLALLTTMATAADVGTIEVDGRSLQRVEWRASTFSLSSQSQATLDIDADGRLAVVWSSRRQQEGQYGVYAQRFGPDGVAIGSETRLNEWTTSHQVVPSVAATDAGWFGVWQSHGQDGDAGSIVARVYDATLTGGSELGVNETTDGHQSSPHVITRPNGEITVVWSSYETDGSRIIMRRYDAEGWPLSEEIAISDAGERATAHSTTAVADGSLVVAYATVDADGYPDRIRVRHLDACGEPIVEALDVAAGGGVIEPVVATTHDGYVVAWVALVGTDDAYTIVARRMNPDLTPAGEAFVVAADASGRQNAAAIATRPDGSFVIAWNAPDGSDDGVFARSFTAAGQPGDVFRLTQHVEGRQRLMPAAGTNRLAFGPGGDLYCVWSGNAGLGDGSSVNVTMLAAPGTHLSTGPFGVTDAMLATAPRGPESSTASPHVPPTFDPRSSEDRGEREVVLGAGGDIGFTGIFNTGWTPPDPHMAVGPDHVVVMTNGAISFFEKDGTETFTDEIEDNFGFWGSVGATGFVFDPEVVYDEMSGRFFALAAEGFGPGGTSFALLAVSDDSDPNGTWFKYRFNTTGFAGDLFDSPNLAVDDEAVYITGDAVGNTDVYAVYIYDKASLLVGNAPAVTNSFTTPSQARSGGVPPVSYDDPPALYIIEHREGGTDSEVLLIAITNPLGIPQVQTTTLAVQPYNAPEDPPQAGTSVRPEAFDARFWSAAYRNGSLWATHHVNSSRVRARWYEIAMNEWPVSGGAPSLVQWGEIDLGGTIRTFFTAITVDDFGNAAMTFARSSPSEFISMQTAYRYASDPLGTFRPPVERKQNTSGYSTSRWGDYAAVNVDPSDGKTIWAHHEWAQGDSWRTWIHGFTPAFVQGDVNCNGTVDTTDLLILLAEWGPCPGCPSDIDGSGVVDVTDILILLGNWG